MLDELDRLEDDDALTALADTVKTLSDHAVESTLVLVGVARSIGELVGEHASIVRALSDSKRAQGRSFSQVLLACALAPKNQLGFFTSGAIRDPLEVIAGRRIEIPAFSNHLSQFLEPERGAVLQREGSSRRYFYRFADPILQPYAVLNGLAEGLITEQQLRRFQQVEPDQDVTPGDFETSKPQSLF